MRDGDCPETIGPRARIDMTKDQSPCRHRRQTSSLRDTAHEIYRAMERRGAAPELHGVSGSWSDGEGDEIVLKDLRAWNRDGTTFSKVICRRDDTAL